jgi:acyl carrier protein
MPFTTPEIEETIARLAVGIAQDLDPEDQVTTETMLIRDLGFASVDFVRLIVDIEKHYGRKLGFLDLVMPNGRYVEDLSVGDFIRFIEKRLAAAPGFEAPAGAAAAPAPAPVPAGDGARVTREMLDAFRGRLPSPERWGRVSEDGRNPRAVFVLSPPRSGSTLLRVILAGNSHLFAPPELHMLDYTTLAQRRTALDNERNRHLLTGAIRAIMHARGCSASEAESLMRAWEGEEMSTHRFFGMLQNWLGERLLVDKTPSYGFHPAILARTEQEFDAPLFIHLVRHPAAMIRSFADAKMDLLVPFMRESGFTRRQIAELVWLLCHENILEFLARIPESRRRRVRFEDVVTQPEATIRTMCDFMGVPFEPAMLNPYENPEQRMTDGLDHVSEYSGDLKFHLHSRIDPEAATRWRRFERGDTLGDLTRAIGEQLGYDTRLAIDA